MGGEREGRAIGGGVLEAVVALLGLVGVLDEHSPSYLSLARGGQPVVVLKELPRGDLYFYVPGGAGDGVSVLSSQSDLFPVPTCSQRYCSSSSGTPIGTPLK